MTKAEAAVIEAAVKWWQSWDGTVPAVRADREFYLAVDRLLRERGKNE
jgi:ABC-type polysaccharide transport system permease subunit